MRAVLPLHPRAVHQAHVRLVDQRSGLQAVARSFTVHASPGNTMEFLVHDRRDGACWLWTFDEGLRFIESVEPIFDGGWDDAETPRLLGP